MIRPSGISNFIVLLSVFSQTDAYSAILDPTVFGTVGAYSGTPPVPGFTYTSSLSLTVPTSAEICRGIIIFDVNSIERSEPVFLSITSFSNRATPVEADVDLFVFKGHSGFITLDDWGTPATLISSFHALNQQAGASMAPNLFNVSEYLSIGDPYVAFRIELLTANYGDTGFIDPKLLTGSDIATSASVPEPTAFVLAAFAFAAPLLRRRKEAHNCPPGRCRSLDR